jgi:DNA modification methylase
MNVKTKEEEWKESIGDDLNWDLSFAELREKDTTKHVHRLHPYKGKFIPQLVEYFLDEKTTEFKKTAYFKPGDTVLDPFMGSGTTLVQAGELGLNSVGIDVSQFNCEMSKVKTGTYESEELKTILETTLAYSQKFISETFDEGFDNALKEKIAEFNKQHFPNPEYKYQVKQGEIDPGVYSAEKEDMFLTENIEMIKKLKTIRDFEVGESDEAWGESEFLKKWYNGRILRELAFYNNQITRVDNAEIRAVMRIIMSRVARSCRSTTHSDLATLKEAQILPYYCTKHYKICTPINSIATRLKQYTNGTIRRLAEYADLRGESVCSVVIHGDSREVDILAEVEKSNPQFAEELAGRKLDGVFTSPPYVGQIDYHEQHAYAYELFAIERVDELEIGPLYKGKGKKAKDDYVAGIAAVLNNVAKYVKDDGDFFLVANDKHDLYPRIAELSKMEIVAEHKRPVLNRTERDRAPYSEIIFHLKKKKGLFIY